MKARKSTKPNPLRYGHSFKNGKFYQFSRRDGVLVVKGWPTLKAWCKPPNRKYFSPCRPEIYLGERPSVSRSWRVTTPPTVDDQWEKENLQLMEGKEPADHIKLFSSRSKIEDAAEVLGDAEMSPDESAYYAIKMRNRAESMRALKSFAETFPVEIRQALAPFGSRQWELARMAKIKGGLDLIRSNPGLAFAIASSWLFRQNKHPTRTAERLLRIPRRKAACWRGFPDSESAVKILGKIPPSACYVPLLLNLRWALIGRLRPDLSEVLKFLPVLNVDVLTFINCRPVLRFATPRLIRDIALKSKHPGCIGEWHEWLRDANRMSKELGRAEEHQPIFSVRGLKRYHDSITAEYTERFGIQNRGDGGETGLNLTTPLPPPPLPGTEAIIPLTTPTDIDEEARKMAHCVLSYLDAIRDGHSYIYRVIAPERATVEIEPHQGRWKIKQLKGYANAEVGSETRIAVKGWIG